MTCTLTAARFGANLPATPVCPLLDRSIWRHIIVVRLDSHKYQTVMFTFRKSKILSIAFFQIDLRANFTETVEDAKVNAGLFIEEIQQQDIHLQQELQRENYRNCQKPRCDRCNSSSQMRSYEILLSRSHQLISLYIDRLRLFFISQRGKTVTYISTVSQKFHFILAWQQKCRALFQSSWSLATGHSMRLIASSSACLLSVITTVNLYVNDDDDDNDADAGDAWPKPNAHAFAETLCLVARLFRFLGNF